MEWRDVVGYDGLYQVSDEGQVRSLDRVIACSSGVERRYKGRALKGQKDAYGYIHVGLWNGSPNTRKVHRLVLEAFVGKRPDNHEACHNNGVRDDNRLENLRWDTKINNSADRERHGTMHRGEQRSFSKLTEADVRYIRSSGLSGIALAKQLGVAKSTVYKTRNGKAWRHVREEAVA